MSAILRRAATCLFTALLAVGLLSSSTAQMPPIALPSSEAVETTATAAPTLPPTPTPAPSAEPISAQTNWLELPVNGATAYAVIALPCYETAESSAVVDTLPAGTCFLVEEENGPRWKVEAEQGEVWVDSAFCLVNLPDVIPSMVFMDTNATASVFVSCGKDIPGITGEALYQARAYNARLERESYIMPVLYPMAQHLCRAQHRALSKGYTLVLYEAYRPQAAQHAVVNGLMALAAQDPEVQAAITQPPWKSNWFIASGISNHQQGYAVDVSLAKAEETEIQKSGAYSYLTVTQYELCEMPTQVHELSPAAASLTVPISPADAELWKTTELAPSMNENALLLREICTHGGALTPLASEWWHFNDYTALPELVKQTAQGAFFTEDCRSKPPERQ